MVTRYVLILGLPPGFSLLDLQQVQFESALCRW